MLNSLLVFCNIHTEDLNGCTGSSTTEVKTHTELTVEAWEINQRNSRWHIGADIMTIGCQEYIVIGIILCFDSHTWHIAIGYDYE